MHRAADRRDAQLPSGGRTKNRKTTPAAPVTLLPCVFSDSVSSDPVSSDPANLVAMKHLTAPRKPFPRGQLGKDFTPGRLELECPTTSVGQVLPTNIRHDARKRRWIAVRPVFAAGQAAKRSDRTCGRRGQRGAVVDRASPVAH